MLRERNYTPCAKLEVIDANGNVLQDLSDDLIVGGTLSVKKQNGMMRTGSIIMDNRKSKYTPSPNGIWFNTLLRLSMGVLLQDGTPYLIPQGWFYVSNPSRTYRPGERTTTLNIVDKWAHVDGSLFGKVRGAYFISVGQTVTLPAAVAATLQQDMGNGDMIDPIAPFFSDNLTEISVPYTLRSSVTGTYGDVLLELNDMMFGSMGYDTNGRMCVESANTNVDVGDAPVMWQFAKGDCEFLGGTITSQMTDVYNDIVIIGATIDGSITKGFAQTSDASIGTNVERIGNKTNTTEESKYYSSTLATQLAEYRLKESQMLGESASFSCAPQYHWSPNGVVLIPDDTDNKLNKWLVTSYSLPINQIGEMTFEATRIIDSAA